MKFRGLKQEYPEVAIQQKDNKYSWPALHGSPAQQLGSWGTTPVETSTARIPLPRNSQQLWAQHKYSILARDVNLYRELGPAVSAMRTGNNFSDLANQLTLALRIQPDSGGIQNALQHMWGYVSDDAEPKSKITGWSLRKLSQEIQEGAVLHGKKYLMHSTALTELETWLPESQ